MMSRHTRALVVGAAVAMILAALVVLQSSSDYEDTPAQRELAQRWNEDDHSTRMAPAALGARAEAQGRSDDLTEPPAEVTAPPRATGPNGEARTLVVSLVTLAALAGVGGLARLAIRRTGRGPRPARAPRIDRGPRVGQPA
jgi:hypothetical protein